MGIFDRFRSAGQTTANSSANQTAQSEQDATRLIGVGHEFEAQGRLDEAMQCYLEAIRLAPNPARAHLNRGNVMLANGDLQGALQAFATALQHKPDYAGAYYNIGNALLNNGQFEQAVASYRRALEIQPDYAEVHCSLGIALKELGQFDGAITSFHRALEINPGLVEVHVNLGNTLQSLGLINDAIASLHRALEIKPNFAEAHCNIGLALHAIGQFDDAVTSYLYALDINPDFAEAHNNLGVALNDLGQLEYSRASFHRALEIKPDFADAHYNLGNALQELGWNKDAIECFRRALEIKPDYADAYNNLGNALKDLGQIENAVKNYRQAHKIKPDLPEAFSNLLLALNYTANHSPEYYFDQACQFSEVVAGKVGVRYSAWQCAAHPERLRVGLVSGDLYGHPVGFFLGLLAHLDPTRIELIAYPTYHKEDDLTARIRPYFSAWKPLYGLGDEAAARLIHADSVHVLVDLAGHTAHNRLSVFAWKPAPVQVTWLGLPATTGLAEMDYVLGDPHAIPAEFDHHFSEAVWRMPDSYLCLTVPTASVDVAPLPALATGQVTFGSFNNLTKMSDTVVAVWSRILQAVPGSRLLLKTKQLGDPIICGQTRQRFAAWGIAADRLILSGTLASRGDHLAAYNKVDIALDTFPYPGVTTSVEALWMGVPVLSLQGDRFLSRTAGSIAHNAGLPDWIAADVDDYVAKAVAFASDLKRLAALRAGLREQVLASPLFDAPRFAKHFEEALWGMWQKYQAQHGLSA